MSSIGRWAYVNTITVRPFVRYGLNGRAEYGAPFDIKCYFTDKHEQVVDSDGIEFTTRRMYLTEDHRVKPLDLVGGQVARVVEFLNSSPFGEEVMDYRIYT